MRGNNNNEAGSYRQPIVKVLSRYGPLTSRELKTRCDSEFHISQGKSSCYYWLRRLKYLGFVQKTGDRYELTSFGNELATRSGNAFFNYYLLGYIRCPECRRRGNLVRCDIEDITKFKGSMSVLVRCPSCGYTKAPLFRNISREEFMKLYNLV